MVAFFGVATAQLLVADGKTADLIIGNNVLAHVPDVNELVEWDKDSSEADRSRNDGVSASVASNRGESVRHHLPRALRLSSLLTVKPIFAAHGMRIFDVEEIGTHGGSLRIYV